MQNLLTIAFILRGEFVPAWYAETIRSCINEMDGNFIFVQLPKQKIIRSSSLLYHAFQLFEQWWFHPNNDSQQPVALDAVMKHHQSIYCEAEGFVMEEEVLLALTSFHPDIIFTIDYDPSQEENLSAIAKYGLWYLHFGVDTFTNAAAPAFWEVMSNSPETGSYLVMKKAARQVILYEGTTATVPFSVRNTLNVIAWKSSSYLLQRVKTLEAAPEKFLDRFQLPFVLSQEKKAVPHNLQMARLFLRNAARYLAYKRKLSTKKDRFTLLFARTNFSFDQLLKATYEKVALPDGVFYADPFVLKHNNKHYIFFEEYRDENGKAHISVVELADGVLSAPTTVLQQAYHHSYPYVFKVEDDVYMIPETASNKTVELFRAVGFPRKWEWVMNLMEGAALFDCSVVFHEGKWWLFANQTAHPAASTNDQLFLYYTDNLFAAQWTPHPQNPVATRASNCRPAGRIFKQEGKIYRPAQNNASAQYGFGLNINEIEVLTTEEYRERLIVAIHPSQLGLKAVHHLDFSEGLMVIDGIA
jgi:hypothetical protein